MLHSIDSQFSPLDKAPSFVISRARFSFLEACFGKGSILRSVLNWLNGRAKMWWWARSKGYRR